MKLLAPAKINLRLKIEARLASGYHSLSMLNVLCDFGDYLDFDFNTSKTEVLLLSKHSLAETTELIDPQKNLIYRALNLFKELFNIDPKVKISLYKNIPIGGGLAGGSSDAAACLKALAKFYNINTAQTDKLIKESVKLGADLPFFFSSGFAKVTGIGEGIQDLTSPIKSLAIMLLLPDLGISTPKAFEFVRSKIDISELNLDSKLKEILFVDQPEYFLEQLKSLVSNDFEMILPYLAPEIAGILSELRNMGFVAGLSGSGSSIFILPKTLSNISFIELNDFYRKFRLKLIPTEIFFHQSDLQLLPI